MLELGKDLLDGVQVRAVGREEPQMRSGFSNCAADGCGFVTAKVVHHDNVAWRQRGHENPFDIGPECVAVDRSVDNPGSIDPVIAQGCDERRGVQYPKGAYPFSRAPRGPQPRKGGHVHLGPGFAGADFRFIN